MARWARATINIASGPTHHFSFKTNPPFLCIATDQKKILQNIFPPEFDISQFLGQMNSNLISSAVSQYLDIIQYLEPFELKKKGDYRNTAIYNFNIYSIHNRFFLHFF